MRDVCGLQSIAKVTEKVAPFIGIFYVGAALIVLIVAVIQGFKWVAFCVGGY
ncbi:hypothetical protein OAN307_c07270 [Octadecabacter antarcticus 307]|uniref:Uncharacterized protein n=1 Tax=Octadecabacter antarcticus 307 TaxID=391626 RepID=M9R1H6_9RHOB|nr:hypothetical protein [Octadecabacter antarcticus]AGI66454.1 hypothetical protein OAN307_c07270 [Octadecabacter antarcticus 307]